MGRQVLHLGNHWMKQKMVQIRSDQDIARTKALLTDLDVKKIGVDRARGIGRGMQIRDEDPISALCGKCITGKCVITASGEVYPCIMARTFSVDNFLQQDIATILTGDAMQTTTTMLLAAFIAHSTRADCPPDDDDPLDCDKARVPSISTW